MFENNGVSGFKGDFVYFFCFIILNSACAHRMIVIHKYARPTGKMTNIQ